MGIPVASVEVGGAVELKELAGCGCVIRNDKESICDELGKVLSDEALLKKWKEQANTSKKLFYKEERIKQADSILKAGMNNV